MRVEADEPGKVGPLVSPWGFLADLLLGDPTRGHPVAGFGTGAARLEKLTYADNRGAGVLHTGLLLGGLAGLGWASGAR